MNSSIASVVGRRVWDSRGRPTVEVEIRTANGAMGRAIAPAGASTGTGEALDLRDGGEKLAGFGVASALDNVALRIAPVLVGRDCTDQQRIDRLLVEIDGTDQFASLGGNAAIATSMAVAHAAAAANGQPLWRCLAGDANPGPLPLPEIQIFGGGAHAARRVDVQDFMVIATGASDYATALEWTAETYRAAGRLMADRGLLSGVADEGGFWPDFETNEQALEMLVRAIESAGLTPGDQMAISLDIAASEFGGNGRYRLARDGRELDSDGLSEMLLDWLEKYPIVSVEDPLAEDDEAGLVAFTRAAGPRVQVIGDDYLVTNPDRVRAGARKGACNAVLIKPNQNGTLSGTQAALEAARAVGWDAVVSARSGESEDVTIVHLAVGWGVAQLKVGSFARSERMAKWNEGLRIGEQLVTGLALPGADNFPWTRSDQ